MEGLQKGEKQIVRSLVLAIIVSRRGCRGGLGARLPRRVKVERERERESISEKEEEEEKDA